VRLGVSIPQSDICCLLVVVDPHFITGDSVIQKGVTFLMVSAQNSIIAVQTVMIVLVHELFWNPSCTKFTEVKSMEGDFIDRTLTKLHLVCPSLIVTIVLSGIRLWSWSVFP
jgi:hypothetical protein